MRALLICPSPRPAFSRLGEGMPLALMPLLGQSLLEYWLSHLACAGARQVLVLAQDQPDRVRAAVGDGARWGLEVKVLSESRELTPAQGLLKYASQLDSPPAQSPVALLDHFPGQPQRPLFETYAGWFAGLQEWMSKALSPDRVGMREVRPGVWVGRHARIAATAQLYAPCWVGRQAVLGERVIVGPRTIVEDGAFLEAGAEVADSSIGLNTFVGAFARLTHSIAWGHTLIHWRLGSVIEVADPFLLCRLRRAPRSSPRRWFTPVSELFPRTKAEAALLWKHLLLNKEG